MIPPGGHAGPAERGVPGISVVVPNYNHARYLARRIESILAQTLGDFELIVLDDASTDDSRTVISRYLGDPRVRFQANESNSGSPFIQWNRGVALARGALVWIAESDDFADPEFLSTLAPVFDRNPGTGLAYCQSATVDAEDRVTGDMADWLDEVEPGRWRADFVSPGSAECERHLLWRNTVPNASAVLFRRQVYLDSGGAPVNMRLSGDWLTWVRMLLISDVAFVSRRLNFFRQHSATVRATTATRAFSLERWGVRSLIARRCRLPRATRVDLAQKTFDEMVWLVGLAPPGERGRTLAACLGAAWPILVRSPGAVLRRGLRRAFRQLSRNRNPD